MKNINWRSGLGHSGDLKIRKILLSSFAFLKILVNLVCSFRINGQGTVNLMRRGDNWQEIVHGS